MGVNLWGAAPLYVNPVPSEMMVTEILAEGKRLRKMLRGLKRAEP
jgi:hypothetical protein